MNRVRRGEGIGRRKRVKKGGKRKREEDLKIS
jgi:hypothetical protein